MTDEITRALDAVRKRVDAATEGPWINNHIGATKLPFEAALQVGISHGHHVEISDIKFVAHSRTDLDALERALRKSIKKIEELNDNIHYERCGGDHSKKECATEELVEIVEILKEVK